MDKKFNNIRAYHTEKFVKLFDPIILHYIEKIIRTTCSSLTLSFQEHCQQQIEEDIKMGATFITNHRDIVLDPVFLSYLLNDKYNIRPYIAIGNNLVKRWWIRHFVRMNRAFIVIRDGALKTKMENLELLSEYIHHLRFFGNSIWIAQREGRAKDGNDITYPGVLKMLCLYPIHENATQAVVDNLITLNLCPVSISYQYDPCDYLKAAEMQLKRDNQHWKKTEKDDMLSMKTGILGKKGEVVFRLTPSINHWINQHYTDLIQLSINDMLQRVASQIDKQIHQNYELFTHDIAFDEYLHAQLQKINIPNKDLDFLTEKITEMYLYPQQNYEKSCLSR